MLVLRFRNLFTYLAISALLISCLAGLSFGQVTQTCESCGMPTAADCQAHLKLVDSNGTVHYAECFKCALKLLKNLGELNITATCDWYGSARTISIYLKDKVNTTIVNPDTALYIDGTSCKNNRIVYDQTAANSLLANNGTSSFITAIQNVTIPANATVMTIAQAATKYAFTSSPDPTPTPTPTPTLTPSPTPTIAPTDSPTIQPSTTPTIKPTITDAPVATSTPATSPLVTQQCEACGMEVSPEAQAKYVITDANGNLHYAECFMCALNMLKNYDQLTIVTYCDWYGSNYPVTVQSSNYGKNVDVNPATAIFLNGGSCVINRVAYNQTAADLLLANGYSNNTLMMQRYALPSSTTVSSVDQAALTFSENKLTQTSQTIPYPLIIASIAGIAIIGASVTAYFKLKTKKT